MKLILASFLLVVWSQATAQFKEIGKVGNNSYYVPNSPPTKLGTGILVWIGTHSTTKEDSHLLALKRFFISCNFSYASSDGINFEIDFFDEKLVTKTPVIQKFQALHSKGLDDRNLQSTTVIDLVDMRDAPEEVKAARPIFKELCMRANPEERNLMIPVSMSSVDKDRKGFISSLVSGTFKSKQGYLEGWIREHGYFEENWSPGGKEYKDSEGNPLKIKKYSDQGHALQLMRFDCLNREFANVSRTNYDRYSQVIDSSSFPQPKFNQAVPGSVAEKLTDTACRIYR